MKAPVLKTVRPARVSGVRIPPPPPASLAFSLSRWRSARKLDFAAQNARISHGQTSNVWVKRTAGLAICLYFSEARSGSGVSQAKLHHRFALTAHRQPVSPFSLSVSFCLRRAETLDSWCFLAHRHDQGSGLGRLGGRPESGGGWDHGGELEQVNPVCDAENVSTTDPDSILATKGDGSASEALREETGRNR